LACSVVLLFTNNTLAVTRNTDSAAIAELLNDVNPPGRLSRHELQIKNPTGVDVTLT